MCSSHVSHLPLLFSNQLPTGNQPDDAQVQSVKNNNNTEPKLTIMHVTENKGIPTKHASKSTTTQIKSTLLELKKHSHFRPDNETNTLKNTNNTKGNRNLKVCEVGDS